MIAVVIPSNRPDSLHQWRNDWAAADLFTQTQCYVVLDEQATWDAIKKDLGSAAWIIPRQTDCIRAYGYLQAYRNGATHLITVDDDCYRHDADHLLDHVAFLDDPVEPDGWMRTVPSVPTRGLPLTRRVGVNHGLWSQTLDVSGAYQLLHGAYVPTDELPEETLIPVGTYAPLSGMNLAWRRELTPLMYFTLQGAHLETGAKWGVDRYGDIWCGIIAKKVCDHLGYAVRSGTPFVRHARASDPAVNAEREKSGEGMTMPFWHAVRDTRLLSEVPAVCYHQIADSVARLGGDYWPVLGRAMHVWAEFFE